MVVPFKDDHVVVRIALLAQLLMLWLALSWALEGNIVAAVIGASGLVISGLALRYSGADIAVWMHSAIFMHLMFGMRLGWYESHAFYDAAVHFVAMAALVGIVLARIDRAQISGLSQPSAPLQWLLAPTLALALGAAWELFEFVLDLLFALNAQPDLRDTNLDLLADLGGGLVAALISALRERSIGPAFIAAGRARIARMADQHRSFYSSPLTPE
jgi:hypothetical protein